MKHEKAWLIIISIILWLALTGGLYWLSTMVSEVGIRIVAILLFWAFLASIPLSYYLGKVEARGFLSGADKVMDNILGKAIEARERKAKPEAPVLSEPQAFIFPDMNQLRSQGQRRALPFDYTEEDDA